MNRRYMDFVPANTKKTVKKVENKVPEKILKKVSEKELDKKALERTNKGVSEKNASRKEPALGVVENIDGGSANYGYLSQDFSGGAGQVKTAKAQKVGNAAKKAEEKQVSFNGSKKDFGTFNPPKSPFINQDRIEKRPLSKNVYKKEIVASKEEPKGPVTIIEKPEKHSRVSLVVIIILTVILGAAAGTVAFFLLPK